MTTNRLASPVEGKARILAPTDPEERRRFWIERGNRLLRGEEPTTKGEYLQPRPDLEWAWENGSYYLRSR